MLLSDFQWSRNPRGMHNEGVFDFQFDIDLYRQTQMGWVKLVISEDEYIRYIPTLFEANVTPVVRVYMPKAGNRPMNTTEQRVYREYARAGVKWFEFYNEPNLGVEWPDGVDPDWRNADMIRGLMDNWLNWAEYIISLGGYPGFIPLAESDQPKSAAVRWMDAMLNDLADRHYARFLNVLRGGAYCATHPYILNHFYQERPGGGPLSARAPSTQVATEGGWHFEYPYDPVSQRNDPGRTVYGGTRLTPYGDPVGLIAMGRMFNERCQMLFGTQAIPVLGTEGGIWDFPAPGEGSLQQDTRFPPYTNESHAEATVAMFDWSAAQAPPWFFGVCLWKEDIYLEKGGRALARLTELPASRKNVPDISVMLDGSVPQIDPEAPPRGPGPVHGQADFHMVLIDRSLSTDWFFNTASNYWNLFRPVVTTVIDFFELMPYEKSLAVTLIISEARHIDLERQIRERYPNAYLDPIIIYPNDTLERVNQIFEMRVQVGRRFG